MNKRSAGETDKRAPIALVLMGVVLALLGSQQMARAGIVLESAQRPPLAFAAAAALYH